MSEASAQIKPTQNLRRREFLFHQLFKLRKLLLSWGAPFGRRISDYFQPDFFLCFVGCFQQCLCEESSASKIH